jgi:hypothetical protein
VFVVIKGRKNHVAGCLPQPKYLAELKVRKVSPGESGAWLHILASRTFLIHDTRQNKKPNPEHRRSNCPQSSFKVESTLRISITPLGRVMGSA